MRACSFSNPAPSGATSASCEQSLKSRCSDVRLCESNAPLGSSLVVTYHNQAGTFLAEKRILASKNRQDISDVAELRVTGLSSPLAAPAADALFALRLSYAEALLWVLARMSSSSSVEMGLWT